MTKIANVSTGIHEGIHEVEIVFVILCLLCLGTFLMTVQGCFTDGPYLKVKTRLLTFSFDMRQARTVTPIGTAQLPRWTTVRVFGIGWPFRPIGWFRNSELGTFLNLAENTSAMCMVSWPKKNILVSPRGGVEAIERQLQAIANGTLNSAN